MRCKEEEKENSHYKSSEKNTKGGEILRGQKEKIGREEGGKRKEEREEKEQKKREDKTSREDRRRGEKKWKK